MLKREKPTHVKNIDKAMLTYLQREKYESQAQPKGFLVDRYGKVNTFVWLSVF